MPSTPGRSRWCIHHRPAGAVLRGCIVHVPAFAEEMNKSRHMVAEQARALAADGWAVLLLDPLGCGDSEGSFDEASWAQWQHDVAAAAHWLVDRHAAPGCAAALWLWGLRAGALLAVAAADRAALRCNFLFWQPAASGQMLLQQFLRLKTAGAMAEGADRTSVDALRRQLAGGSAVEVAGYLLSPGLALGLDAARLAPPEAPARVVWLELSLREGAALLPASAETVAAWRAAGHSVLTQVVLGPAFWQTVEIERAPALVNATLAALNAPREVE